MKIIRTEKIILTEKEDMAFEEVNRICNQIMKETKDDSVKDTVYNILACISELMEFADLQI